MKSRSINMTLLPGILMLLLAASLLSWAADSQASKNGPIMTSKEAKTLIATAKTAKDHEKLARYFNQQAEQYEAEAKDHEEMEQAYRKNPMPKNFGGVGPIAHCEFLTKSNRDMAKTAREMAAAHGQMAKETAK